MTLQQEPEALDREIRRFIYDRFITHAKAPVLAEAAQALSLPLASVSDSFRRLAQGHVVVLQPGSGEILMANPFSAVPTAFVVRSGDRTWWGNCIWDGLGIAAMVGTDAEVSTACPDCGESLSLTVRDKTLSEAEGVAHFSVPAARWWEDIVFT
ncbi:MAG: hypothetical protein IT330_04675 [Anaerolineae bacterium]|nr:hypothetical protein [Anaerolineae bacterium]